MGSTVSLLVSTHRSVDSAFVDLAAPDMVKFGIESKVSSTLTSTNGFKAAIISTMHDMRDICSMEESESIHSHL